MSSSIARGISIPQGPNHALGAKQRKLFDYIVNRRDGKEVKKKSADHDAKRTLLGSIARSSFFYPIAHLYMYQPYMHQPLLYLSKKPLTKSFEWLKSKEGGGLDTLREETIKSSDGNKISLWLTNNPNFKKTKLYFHGRTGNITSFIENLPRDYKNGYNVCVFSYRGYSGNKGLISTKGLINDSKAVVDHLLKEEGIQSKDLIVVAHSLGCAVAIATFASRWLGNLKQKFQEMVLLAPFDSIRRMADTTPFKVLGSKYLLAGLDTISDLWNNTKDIVNARKLFDKVKIYHGDDDNLISNKRSKVLEPAVDEYEIVEGADHFDIVDKYQDRVYGAAA